MKKINHTFLMLLISSLAFAQFPSPYCGPLTFTTNVEPITLVDFAGINNPSSFVTGGAAHQDFTGQTAQVTAGQTYPIALKGNTDGNFINLFSVYMDWNHDNDFSDQGEAYLLEVSLIQMALIAFHCLETSQYQEQHWQALQECV
jgi:hypothetical protein